MATLKQLSLVSLKAKMLFFCLAAGLVPLLIMGVVSVHTATGSLTRQAFDSLASVRDARTRALHSLTETWFKEVRIYAAVKEVYNALGMLRMYDDFSDSDYLSDRDYVAPAFAPYVEVLGYGDALLFDDYGYTLFSYNKAPFAGQNVKSGPLKDTNLGRAWAKAVQGEPAFADFEPFAPLNNQPMAFILAPVHSHVGDIQGVAALMITQENMDRALAVSGGATQADRMSESYLVGPDLLPRSATRKSPTLEAAFAAPQTQGLDTEAVAKALAGLTGIVSAPGYDGRQRLSAFAPVQVGHVTWALVADIPEDQAFAPVWRLRWAMLLIGLAAAAAVVVGAVLFLRAELNAPLARIQGFLDAVSKGDYQAELPGRYKGEMAHLAGNILHMVDELKNRLGFSSGILAGMTVPCLVADEDSKVSYVNQPLLDLLGIKEPGASLKGQPVSRFLQRPEGEQTITRRCFEEKRPITGVERDWTDRQGNSLRVRIDAAPLYDLDGKPIGAFAVIMDLTDIRAQEARIQGQNRTMLELADRADRIAHDVTEEAGDLAKRTRSANQATQDQFGRIESATQALDEMNAALEQTASQARDASEGTSSAVAQARQGMQVMERSTQAFGQVQELTGDLKQDMDNLGQAVADIGAIIGVINDIADQTNLLALNAAIEAARAGDAGRGFAVVADEVRKLAEKTVQATAQVSRSIGSIRQVANQSINSTDQAAEAVERARSLFQETGQALTEIVAVSERSSTSIETIAQAAVQQSVSHDEITRTMNEARTISQRIAEEMDRSAQAVSRLADTAGDLKVLIGSIRT